MPDPTPHPFDLLVCSHSLSSIGPCWNCAKRLFDAAIRAAEQAAYRRGAEAMRAAAARKGFEVADGIAGGKRVAAAIAALPVAADAANEPQPKGE